MSGVRVNWFYLLILLLMLAMLFISLRFFKGSSSSSIGVTYAKEYIINAEKAAFVKEVRVVSGQQVKAGDLLITLASNLLEVDIAKMENRLAVLRSELSEKAKLADSRIALIRADQGILIENLNSEILQAESELRMNENLSKQFSSRTDSVNAEHPVQMKLRALRNQRDRQEEAITIKVKEILQAKETEQRLLTNQVILLEKELQLLKGEQSVLSKYASADGVVENLFVHQGEQVDAFTPLISLHPVHPTTVIGYLVGKKNELPVGTNVTIRSYEGSANDSEGKVIGYGAVVELPQILQKSTAVKAFGREVFIEIPPKNGFANGEKVLIQ